MDKDINNLEDEGDINPEVLEAANRDRRMDNWAHTNQVTSTNILARDMQPTSTSLNRSCQPPRTNTLKNQEMVQQDLEEVNSFSKDQELAILRANKREKDS